jgi:hypothetical protein
VGRRRRVYGGVISSSFTKDIIAMPMCAIYRLHQHVEMKLTLEGKSTTLRVFYDEHWIETRQTL